MSGKHVRIGVVAATAVLGFAAAASAQVVQGGVYVGGSGFGASGSVGVTTPPPPPPPQPVYVQPQPVYQQPVYVQQPQPVYVVQRPYYQDVGRVRFGWDVGAGGIVSNVSSFALNFGLRLGWQLNSDHAVYYQGNLPIGIVDGTSGGTHYSGAMIAWTNAIMYEFTLGHLLHLGAGPAADWVVGGVCASGSSTDCVGGVGWAFGLNGRIALTLGNPRPGRRTGFSIGLDLQPIFFPNGVVMFATGNIGLEYY